ncbi:triacylglycerol lipase [Gordonia sp. 'Campus']|uniref:esterase/lipase family protein n=1 Tax=Gordonia sp. 'Campus' TaxID=2915824 RepID=UPI001EE3CB74|nr:lipase [Gordonia sp. 'Campus']
MTSSTFRNSGSHRALRRTAAAALTTAALSIAGLGAAGTASAAPSEVSPGDRVVVIVPGQQLYADAQQNEEAFRPLADAVRAAGHTVVFAHAAGREVDADARLIATTIAPFAGTARSVGIVAHSAGGLGARSYLKFLGGSDIVDEYIAIGTAQYGSPGGCSQPRDGGYDTCMYADAITELNRGADAPGPTRYSVVQSDGEWTDGRLDGTAQCRAYSPVPLANTGFDHTIEMRDPTVIANVLTSLRGSCAGDVVTDPVDSFDWQSTLFPGIPGPAGEAIRDAVPGVVPAP